MITINNQPSGMVLDSDFIQYDVEVDNANHSIEFYSSELRLLLPKYELNKASIRINNLYRNKQIGTIQITEYIKKINNIFRHQASISEKNKEEYIDLKLTNLIEVIYSTMSMQQIPVAPISFLGISDALIIASHGILSVPFLIQEKQSIQVRVIDQKNNLIALQFLDNAQGYYLFEKQLQLDYPVEALTLEVIGKQTIQKQIRVLKNKRFKPLNIRFKNQFGAILHTQLFASMKMEEELNYATIRDQNGRLLTNEINSSSNLTVNTGYLLNSEIFVISQILNSLQVEIEINGSYTQVVPTQKKVPKWESNKWVTATQLTFQYINYEAN
ncbi:hypothetical protein [Myroides fluvii]|uniref:hypothetical protein n=1 Tax=Myroides fluvii TaxID=2572594 RepID=UPI00131C84A8|nr:hypothetical protein [Myroides fluvii]